MPAPEGNQNATRGRIWRDAIERALKKRSKVDQVQALDELAEKFLQQVEAGDISAFKEFGDRIEGKAIQQTEISGPGGSAVLIKSTSSDDGLV